jgi:hypothetical protein
MIRLMLLATLSLSGSADVSPLRGEELVVRASQVPPSVQVWTDQEVVQRWERARVWIQTDQDAYVTVLRIDTDGRVRVLYPHQPWDDNYIGGGHELEIWNPDRSRGPEAFVVDDYPGTGYLFAVASSIPFEYGSLASAEHWDYRNVAYSGRIRGDPFAALMDLIDSILPTAGTEYSYDVFTYHVGEIYDYPRFLCYECHAYTPYQSWNPYRHYCAAYQMVVFDAPYYYPARVYAGTRVVYATPQRMEPRFVFKQRGPDEPHTVTIRDAPSNATARRAFSKASAADVGGIGTVPTPVTRPTVLREQPDLRSVDSRRPTARSTARSISSQAPRPDAVVRLRPKLERRIPNSRGGKPVRRPTRVRPPTQPVRRPASPPSTTPQVRPKPTPPI